jgi:chromosomal replication initiation ATPase DnaA
MGQLSFEWPARVSYAPEDFILSDSNANAVAFTEHWPEQMSTIALLSGPQACGKTHLAHCWAQRTDAVFLDSATLGTRGSEAVWGNTRYAVLEDLQQVRDEAAMFHLLRHVETHPVNLLLTSALPAALLAFTLPDLRSRLLAYPAVSIAPPDDALLTAFIVKCFSDHQIRIREEVVTFLLLRLERSLHSVRNAIETLVRKSDEAKREITVPWIKSLHTTL